MAVKVFCDRCGIDTTWLSLQVKIEFLDSNHNTQEMITHLCPKCNSLFIDGPILNFIVKNKEFKKDKT